MYISRFNASYLLHNYPETLYLLPCILNAGNTILGQYGFSKYATIKARSKRV